MNEWRMDGWVDGWMNTRKCVVWMEMFRYGAEVLVASLLHHGGGDGAGGGFRSYLCR